MKAKLTLQVVKAAKPEAERYTIWDAKVKGFGLRVNADGSKTYVLKYVFQSRQPWFTIGKHGSPYTPDKARGRRRARSIQWKPRRRSARRAPPFRSYAIPTLRRWILTKFDTPKKASTLATDRGRIDRHIKPLLRRKRVRDVTPEDIETFLFDAAAGKTAADVRTRKRGRAIVKEGHGNPHGGPSRGHLRLCRQETDAAG